MTVSSILSRRAWLALAASGSLAACSPVLGTLNLVSGGQSEGTRLDRPYGPDPRHRYDLYGDADSSVPLVVFIHGGGWDSLSKDQFAFVGNALVAQGFSAALINYRLGPNTPFPGFVFDAARAVALLRKDTGRRVVLMGHSAGAHIAALVTLDPRYLAAFGTTPCEAVAGFAGLAGPYDFLPLTEERYKAIFPANTRPQSQPINFVGGPHPPILLAHGLDDATVEPDETRRLAAALRRAGGEVETLLLEEVDHTDIIGAYGPGLSRLAPIREPVAAFIERIGNDAGC